MSSTTPAGNQESPRRILDLIADPHSGDRELRAHTRVGPSLIGYGDEPNALTRHAAKLNIADELWGIPITPDTSRERLLRRSPNPPPRRGQGATDAEARRRRLLPIATRGWPTVHGCPARALGDGHNGAPPLFVTSLINDGVGQEADASEKVDAGNSNTSRWGMTTPSPPPPRDPPPIHLGPAHAFSILSRVPCQSCEPDGALRLAGVDRSYARQ